jgi:hypothetical protein
VPVTNLAQFGYAADTQTSPSNLVAFQAHLGHLAATGSSTPARSPTAIATRRSPYSG